MKNDWLAELIRKSTRRGLTVAEQAELDSLQADVDQRLGHWDDELFEQLSDLEQGVENLRGDDK